MIESKGGGARPAARVDKENDCGWLRGGDIETRSRSLESVGNRSEKKDMGGASKG